MGTADRLRYLMDKRGLSQSDIIDLVKPYCKDLGVKIGKSAISQYVNGKHEPTQRSLTALGLALNVSEGWLMGLDVPMERNDNLIAFGLPDNVMPSPVFRRVPRVGRIACGSPILAEENIEEYDSVPNSIDCTFTLLCRGDSMINARIYDGDIVCIRAQESVENGEIAAVMVGENEATLKRVYVYDDHIVLQAENPQYKPLSFWEEEMNQVRIIGRATHLIAKVN